MRHERATNKGESVTRALNAIFGEQSTIRYHLESAWEDGYCAGQQELLDKSERIIKAAADAKEPIDG